VNEGKIDYNIPCSVLDVEGELEVQLVFQNEAGDIWKSYVKEFAVRYSINAVDDIPDKPDFIAEAQKVIDTAEQTAHDLEERANNGDFDGKTSYLCAGVENGNLIIYGGETDDIDFEINVDGELEVLYD
jgi:hypothetical protein